MVATDFGQLARVAEPPLGSTDSITREGEVRTPDASDVTSANGQGESPLPPLGEPLRDSSSEPDRSTPRNPQERDPTDPRPPDDAPEPSASGTSTLDMKDDEPKSTGLFSEIKGVPPASTGVSVLDSRLVEIDLGQLADVIEEFTDATASLPTLVMNLFDDVVFIGVVEHVEPTSSGHSLWGSLEGVDQGTMTLVVNGSVVAGTVRTPDAVFTVKTTGQGEYVVRQIDESSLPPHGEPLRDSSSEPDRYPQGRDPADPGHPYDSPEPSSPRKPTSEVVDGEPKSTGLFSAIEGVTPMRTGVDTLNSRMVEIDFAQLTDVIEAPMDQSSGLPTLELNLFDNIVYTGVVENVEPTSSGHALWGTLKGVDLGTLTMVVNGSVVAGTVRTSDAVYAISTIGQGEYVVRHIDTSSLPPLGEPIIGSLSDLPSRSQQRSSAGQGPLDDGSKIDVMVIYTPEAKHFGGGRAAIEALIDLLVTGTNRAYASSEVIQRIRLVFRDEVEYVEDGASIVDLRRLRGDSDGYLEQVHSLRDMYAADLVHILVSRSDVGGRAQLHTTELAELEEPFGFGLTLARVWAELIFAHELGHNMGLRHDRYVEPGAGSAWNFGYVNQRAFDPESLESSHWRTVMAYDNQCDEVGGFYCPRIPYFSNPDLTYLGDPLGVPVSSPSIGVDGPADAVRTLNARREITSNFRRSSSSPTPRAGLTMSRYWAGRERRDSRGEGDPAQAIGCRYRGDSVGHSVRCRHLGCEQDADHSCGSAGERRFCDGNWGR